ncbi:MAG: hypothetical protein ACTHJ4_07885 [Candidatus Nucleicultricaceae bacterium]|jgi:hypothetical protein
MKLQCKGISQKVLDSITPWLFFFTKYFTKIQIDAEPHLPPEALNCWKKHVSNASVYVEYGGGGSTASALNMGPKVVITVESDFRFHKALKGISQSKSFIPLYADIGLTAKWGQPLLKCPKNKWIYYPLAPILELDKRNLMPDVVLIDGRFRVASTLAMIFYTLSHKTVFLIDDFRDRPEYRILLEFLEPTAFHDRLLEARIKPDIKAHRVLLSFIKFIRDYR